LIRNENEETSSLFDWSFVYLVAAQSFTTGETDTMNTTQKDAMRLANCLALIRELFPAISDQAALAAAQAMKNQLFKNI
jgi:hypothetical protein